MKKQKFPQKHFPGSKYPGIEDKDLVQVEVATHNPWTGKTTPAKFTFPDGEVILIHPLK